jgi:DNA-binding XRE family transcriptional regulator
LSVNDPLRYLKIWLTRQDMVNAAQLRAARVWLSMSQDEVASEVGLTRQTINRLERDASSAQDRTIRDVRRMFEDRGIEFLFLKGEGVGICLKRPD